MTRNDLPGSNACSWENETSPNGWWNTRRALTDSLGKKGGGW